MTTGTEVEISQRKPLSLNLSSFLSFVFDLHKETHPYLVLTPKDLHDTSCHTKKLLLRELHGDVFLHYVHHSVTLL